MADKYEGVTEMASLFNIVKGPTLDELFHAFDSSSEIKFELATAYLGSTSVAVVLSRLSREDHSSRSWNWAGSIKESLVSGYYRTIVLSGFMRSEPGESLLFPGAKILINSGPTKEELLQSLCSPAYNRKEVSFELETYDRLPKITHVVIEGVQYQNARLIVAVKCVESSMYNRRLTLTYDVTKKTGELFIPR